jgi:hypothetical protein
VRENRTEDKIETKQDKTREEKANEQNTTVLHEPTGHLVRHGDGGAHEI